MTKKFMSMFLALAMCLSLAVLAWAAEDKSDLEAIKQNYIKRHGFYQIVDADYFAALDEDEVIEEFYGISVTKRLFDENMVLDIDKVTEDDIVPGFLMPNSRTIGMGDRHTLGSSNDNVVVLAKI